MPLEHWPSGIAVRKFLPTKHLEESLGFLKSWMLLGVVRFPKKSVGYDMKICGYMQTAWEYIYICVPFR